MSWDARKSHSSWPEGIGSLRCDAQPLVHGGSGLANSRQAATPAAPSIGREGGVFVPSSRPSPSEGSCCGCMARRQQVTPDRSTGTRKILIQVVWPRRAGAQQVYAAGFRLNLHNHAMPRGGRPQRISRLRLSECSSAVTDSSLSVGGNPVHLPQS
jgi:hypothetical protein